MSERDTRFDFLLPRDAKSLSALAGTLVMIALKDLANVEWEDFAEALEEKVQHYPAFRILPPQSQEAVIEAIHNTDLQPFYAARPDPEE